MLNLKRSNFEKKTKICKSSHSQFCGFPYSSHSQTVSLYELKNMQFDGDVWADAVWRWLLYISFCSSTKNAILNLVLLLFSIKNNEFQFQKRSFCVFYLGQMRTAEQSGSPSALRCDNFVLCRNYSLSQIILSQTFPLSQTLPTTRNISRMQEKKYWLNCINLKLALFSYNFTLRLWSFQSVIFGHTNTRDF